MPAQVATPYTEAEICGSPFIHGHVQPHGWNPQPQDSRAHALVTGIPPLWRKENQVRGPTQTQEKTSALLRHLQNLHGKERR